MISQKAADPKEGMTLHELTEIVESARMNGLPADSLVRADVGLRGQIKILHVR